LPGREHGEDCGADAQPVVDRNELRQGVNGQ
jgi:hypothetical protein